jgi:YbbR domain-containing protein
MLRWVLDQFGLFVTAFAFAVIVWAVATSEQNPEREAIFAEAVPLEVVSPSSLVVSQMSVETVRVRVRAPQTSWDELQRGKFHALVDLRSYSVGRYDAPINVSVDDTRATVLSVEPSTLSVTIEPAKSRFIDAHVQVLDDAPLGYTFKPPTLSQTQVTVSGPASLVDQVAEVVADVFIRGARAQIERDAALVARDSQGKEIKGVSLSPTNVVVKITVEQRVGFKDVSIKTVLRGNVASGYWVSNIVVTPSTATVVGNADALANVSGFVETVPIDINGATADIGSRPNLMLPDGVSVLNNESINVRISVTPILSGQTVRRKVTLLGLRTGLAATISPESVDVIISGPLTNLQTIPPEAAVVVLDASGLGPGIYPLKPRVLGVNDPLKVQSLVPDIIQLIITDQTAPTR